MRGKKFLSAFLIFFLILSILLILPMLILGGSQLFDALTFNEKKEKRLAEDYLFTKYSERFVVEQETVKSLPPSGEVVMKAYPEKAEHIIFNVERYNGKFYDDYIMNSTFAQMQRDILGEDPFYLEAYVTYIYDISQTKTDYRRTEADWQKELKEFKDENLNFFLYTSFSSDMVQQAERFRNIYNFIKIIRENSIQTEFIGIRYETIHGKIQDNSGYKEKMDHLLAQKLGKAEGASAYSSCRIPLQEIATEEDLTDFIANNCDASR